MNILIDINHPGHVHLLKNLYWILTEHGHNVIITVKDIKIATRLLSNIGIPFINLGKKKDSIFMKGVLQVYSDLKLLSIVRKNKIEIGIGSSLGLVHVSAISKMKSIMLDDDDDEVEPLVVKFGHSFADIVLSPSSIKRKTKKNIPYQGFHELAYLHPNVFTPDKTVLKEAGLKESEPFFILRFVAFNAHHDKGQKGISLLQKRRLIELLNNYGRIIISSEREIKPEFEQYRLNLPPEKIHSLIYYATLFLGDSQTMTSEAAILGTPALKCNTFSGGLSVPNEIEQKYGLCYSYMPNEFEKFLYKAEFLIQIPDLKQEWQIRRQKLLENKINVAAFFVWFIENYPVSSKIMKDNPDYQYNFR